MWNVSFSLAPFIFLFLVRFCRACQRTPPKKISSGHLGGDSIAKPSYNFSFSEDLFVCSCSLLIQQYVSSTLFVKVPPKSPKLKMTHVIYSTLRNLLVNSFLFCMYVSLYLVFLKQFQNSFKYFFMFTSL